MEFAGAIVVFTATFPHTEIRRSVSTLHIEDKVLHEVYLICRKDDLQHATARHDKSNIT